MNYSEKGNFENYSTSTQTLMGRRLGKPPCDWRYHGAFGTFGVYAICIENIPKRSCLDGTARLNFALRIKNIFLIDKSSSQTNFYKLQEMPPIQSFKCIFFLYFLEISPIIKKLSVFCTSLFLIKAIKKLYKKLYIYIIKNGKLYYEIRREMLIKKKDKL